MIVIFSARSNPLNGRYLSRIPSWYPQRFVQLIPFLNKKPFYNAPFEKMFFSNLLNLKYTIVNCFSVFFFITIGIVKYLHGLFQRGSGTSNPS